MPKPDEHPESDEPMLDERYGFAEVVSRNLGKFRSQAEGTSFEDGFLYYGSCGARRRVRTTIVYSVVRDYQGGFSFYDPIEGDEAYYENYLRQLAPSLFVAVCLQCGAEFAIVVYALEAGGPGIVALPAVYGGLRTPHTPPAVSYYLDQAHRAESVGANSAALAMYRSALEQVLHEQGFEDRMVGPKLRQLHKALGDGSAPKWAMELDPTFLSVINKLGSGSLHANEGDITLQAELDTDLLRLVRETFEELLVVVYEREHARKSRLDALQAKADVFDAKHPTPTPGQST